MQTKHKKHMCRWILPGLLGLALCAPVPNTYAATIEAGFSPEGTALQLVIKTIETAQQEIRLMGYSFTSPEVVRSLIAAKRRGVDGRGGGGARNKKKKKYIKIYIYLYIIFFFFFFF